MHIQLMIIVLWLQYNFINIIGFDHACLTYAMQLYICVAPTHYKVANW